MSTGAKPIELERSREPRAAPGAERGCSVLALAGGRSLLQADPWKRTGREPPRARRSRSQAARQAVKWFVKCYGSVPLPFKTPCLNLSDSAESGRHTLPLLHQRKERCSKTSALLPKAMKQRLCLPSGVPAAFSLQTFWDRHYLFTLRTVLKHRDHPHACNLLPQPG